MAHNSTHDCLNPPFVHSKRYYIGPVRRAFVYRSDVVLERVGFGMKPPELVDTQRDKITRLSRQSRARLAFVANNADCEWESLVTLTYPAEYPTNGKVVKRHLGCMLASLRRRFKGLLYLWFLEFQERGAPHIHILLTLELPKDKRYKRIVRGWLALRWYEIVGSEDVKHLLAGTSWERVRCKDGLRHYAVKYASKTRQKEVPLGFQDVGRFWGHSKALTCNPISVEEVTGDDVRERLSDWPYLQNVTEMLPRVLYNASKWWP